ncbi:MAG: hypothetical protein QM775_35050 [Pirellulales bacterium]
MARPNSCELFFNCEIALGVQPTYLAAVVIEQPTETMARISRRATSSSAAPRLRRFGEPTFVVGREMLTGSAASACVVDDFFMSQLPST